MRALWPLVVGALLMCTAAAANPAPSFFGDTGVILTPNTEVADRHTATPQWHMVDGPFGTPPRGNTSGNWDSAGALFGITDRWEVYLGHFSYDDWPFNLVNPGHWGGFVAHTKAQAMREPDDPIGLAIGVRNIGRDTIGPGPYDEYEPTIYGVASKLLFGSPEEDNFLRLNLGMQFANEDDFMNEEYWPDKRWPWPPWVGSDHDRDSIFGSFEWMICKYVTVMMEAQEANTQEQLWGPDEWVFNYGARFNPCERLAVDVSLIDDAVPNQHHLAFGISGVLPFNTDALGSPEDRKVSHFAGAPSFFGDTGLVLMPNAMTTGKHGATPVYHHSSATYGDPFTYPGNSNTSGDYEAVGALFGVHDRVEVYVGQFLFDDYPYWPHAKQPQESQFTIHAKAQALREPENWCNLAVGVRDVGRDTVGWYGNDEPYGYVVATKTLKAADEEEPSFLRASLGMTFANEDSFLTEEHFPGNAPGNPSDYDDDSLFAGIEWMPCKWVTLLGEVVESGFDASNFNFGARLHPIEELSLDLFLIDDNEAQQHEFGWGLSYRIPW